MKGATHDYIQKTKKKYKYCLFLARRAVI